MDIKNIINVRQDFHLGDNIINFIFFKQIKEYIENNNIIINYRCHRRYHQNISNFNCSKNIKILNWENVGYHLWQGECPSSDSIFYEDRLCMSYV
jgi:hypothetical protein